LLQHTATYTASFISAIIIFLQDLAPNVTSIPSYIGLNTHCNNATHTSTHVCFIQDLAPNDTTTPWTEWLSDDDDPEM